MTRPAGWASKQPCNNDQLMANVLVTGATGFIGSNLVRALVARGDNVTCLVRKTSKVDRLRPLDVALVYGDVTDRENLSDAVSGNDVVYHVAGCITAVRKEQFYRINHEGTANIASACAEQAHPPVLVITSSLAAAGPEVDNRPRTETDPPAPVSHYGWSKRAGELAAQQQADRVPITIVRPAIVFGRADRMCLEIFKPIARFGVHMVPQVFSARFSLVNVVDLVELMILAARRGTRLAPPNTPEASRFSGYYFAACDEHPTYAELGRMIGRALGRRWVLTLPITTVGTWIAAAVSELTGRIRRKEMCVNLDKAKEITAGSWTCSSRAAAEEMGFAVGAPLIERLRQTVEWYRKEGWL